MKKRSLFAQIMALLLLVLVVPTTLVTTYNIYSNLSYAEEEIAAQAKSQLDSVSATNEMVLFNLVKSTLRLVQSGTFKQIRGLSTYEELNDGYENIKKAMDLRTLFEDLLMNETAVHSAYFILEDSNYVVSSDKGIARLNQYRSQAWLIDVLKDLDSLSGTWVPRNMPLATRQQWEIGSGNNETIPVLSYVYTLKTLASSIKGSVVVNVYEKDISTYLNPNEDQGASQTILIDGSGSIIASPSKGQLYETLKGQEVYATILKTKKRTGYFYEEAEGHRYLYVYKRSDYSDWIYISKTDVSLMMDKVNRGHIKGLILIGFTILIGGLVIYFLMLKTLRPVKDLVAAVQEEDGFLVDERNELTIISKAFSRMKEEGKSLSTALEKNESKALRLALRDALRGEVAMEENRQLLSDALPYPNFMVAYVGVDQKSLHYRVMNEEERKFFRFQMNAIIEEQLEAKEIKGKAIRHIGTITAVVMCFKAYDEKKTKTALIDLYKNLQKVLGESLKCTVTIGLSSVHCGEEAIHNCALEADTAYRHKLLMGIDHVIVFQDEMMKKGTFFYPYKSEERILNYLKASDEVGLVQELKTIRVTIQTSGHISLDNVMFIYNQLAGVIIRYLVESQVNTFSLFGEYGYIYEKIANLETMEAMEEAIAMFALGVIGHMRSQREGSYLPLEQRILAYFEDHYREEIDFEIMADTLGVSYSYMRRIIKQTMDQSLLDCLNVYRINQVKKLLAEGSDLTLCELAEGVGYRNVQSLNRYFKKFEGIAPSAYREFMAKPT